MEHRFCVRSVQQSGSGEFNKCDPEEVSVASVNDLWEVISARLDAGRVVTDVRNALGGTPVFEVQEPYIMTEGPHAHWRADAICATFGRSGLSEIFELRGCPVRFVTKLARLTPL